MRYYRTLVAGLVLAFSSAAQPQGATTDWPTIALPEGARTQSIAKDMVFNGRATRLIRFEADGSDKALRDFFFQQFGQKVVENRVKDDLTLGARRGDYFVTVQLHAAGAAKQGTLMVTRLAGPALTSTVAAATRRWLPPDSQLISSMQTEDGGRRALTLVAVNRSGVLANRDAVVAAMQAASFRVQRSEADERRATVQLSSDTEDAQVVISQSGEWRSVVVTRMSQVK